MRSAMQMRPMLGSMRGAAREAIACMQQCPLRHCLLKACVTKVHYVCLHALQPWLGQPWLGCAVHALSAVLGPCCTVSCMSGVRAPRALALTAHGSRSCAEEQRSTHAQSAVHSHACAAQVRCDACGVLVPRGERIRVRPQLMPACPPTRQAFIMPALESSLI